MNTGLKEEIITLRIKGKSFNEIERILDCSKSTISYHCNKMGIGGKKFERMSVERQFDVNEFYKTHTLKETAEHFNISMTSVVRYTNNKDIKLTDLQLKDRNYKRVKHHRQKIKEKCIEYKGGECIKCGYKKCKRALEFHHLDRTKKDFTVASYSVLSFEKLKPELDKCILVCSNCHREMEEEIYLKSCSNPPV